MTCDVQVYQECLQRQRCGIPIFLPSPPDSAPAFHRAEGVHIGDVGVLDSAGYFDFLFSIRDQDVRSALSDEEVRITSDDIMQYSRYFGPRSILSHAVSTRVSANISASTDISPLPMQMAMQADGSFDFEFSAEKCAILVLPDGASEEKLRSPEILLFHEDLMAYVEYAERRFRSSGPFVLVTRHLKCRSWATSAAYNTSGNLGGTFALSTLVGGAGVAAFAYRQDKSAPRVNTGPEVPSTKSNQCVFLDGYYISKRKKRNLMSRWSPVKVTSLGDGKTIYPASASRTPPPATTPSSLIMSPLDRNLSPRTSFALNGNVDDSEWDSTSYSDEMANDGETYLRIEEMTQRSEILHPCDVLNQYLLQKFPEAEIAVTHGSDYMSLYGENENHAVNQEVLFARLEERYHVLLKSGVLSLFPAEEFNKLPRSQEAPLHAAACLGDVASIQEQLAAGARADRMDATFRTPLSYACEHGQIASVRVLLANNTHRSSSITLPDIDGRGPVSYAAEHGHLHIIKLLAASNARSWSVAVAATDSLKRTPISYAAEAGYLEIVKFLREQASIDNIERPDKYGRTPISYAAEEGHLHIVKFLREGAVSKGEVGDFSGRTPIAYAAQAGHLETVKFLSLTEPDSVNSKALDGAEEYGHTEIQEFLRGTLGKDPNSQSLLDAFPKTLDDRRARTFRAHMRTRESWCSNHTSYGSTDDIHSPMPISVNARPISPYSDEERSHSAPPAPELHDFMLEM